MNCKLIQWTTSTPIIDVVRVNNDNNDLNNMIHSLVSSEHCKFIISVLHCWKPGNEDRKRDTSDECFENCLRRNISLSVSVICKFNLALSTQSLHRTFACILRRSARRRLQVQVYIPIRDHLAVKGSMSFFGQLGIAMYVFISPTI